MVQTTLSELHMEPNGENSYESPFPTKKRPKPIKFNLHQNLKQSQFNYIQIPPITALHSQTTSTSRFPPNNEANKQTISTIEQNSNQPHEWHNMSDFRTNRLPIIRNSEKVFPYKSFNGVPPHLNQTLKETGRQNNKFVLQTNKLQERFSKMLVKRNKQSFPPKPKVGERISILGKPLLPTRSKPLSFLYERIQVYKFLQKPSGFIPVTYHLIVALIIIISLMFFSFTTVPDLVRWSINALRVFDYLILSILVVEFVLICWASPCIGKYQGIKGTIRFVCSPFRLLDLALIGISAMICWTHWLPPQHNLLWLRCGQIAQFLRLENRFKPWRLFSSMFCIQRKALLSTAYMCFLVLIVLSYIMYYCEKDEADTAFTNIPNSVYWGIITVCSIGYGDISPTTTAGRIICGLFAVIGMILYAVPSGIIATGLALKIQESDREKHFVQQRVPAALLIQCAWRRYAASADSNSDVTWKQYFVRFQSSENHENTNKTGMHKSWSEYFNLRSHIHSELIENDQDQNQISSSVPLKQLTPVQKNCIRFIRVLKFEVSRKKLRSAFQPYDIKDVMQQYSEGHSDVVGRVRFMQTRICTLEYSMQNLAKMLKQLQTAHIDKMDRLEHTFECLKKKVNLTLLHNRDECFNDNQTSDKKKYHFDQVKSNQK